MSKIQSFLFDPTNPKELGEFPLLKDWPVVYILENGREVYIGQTTSMQTRSRDHLKNPLRTSLNQMHVVLDEEFNVSAALDTESQLIQYFAAEGSMQIQNGNSGLVDHSYYDKERYRAKLETTLWNTLIDRGLVKKQLKEIRNSEIFKYSPYKALTEDQLLVANTLIEALINGAHKTHIVNGGPGTGKSVLATHLIKSLQENPKTANFKVALVVPMSSLRKSLENTFARVPGLSKSMVIGPSKVVEKEYDLIVVDEAHRLRQRRNIAHYSTHDSVNRRLGLGDEGTELDWILASSKSQIFFYDAEQSIKPTDIDPVRFKELSARHHYLSTQHRVRGGDAYIEFIQKTLSGEESTERFKNYDLKIFSTFSDFLSAIKQKDAEFGLCRVVAGFAWRRVTGRNPNLFDIDIEGIKLRWNSQLTDWVNSSNALNEVGCIHTIQGYDLNYVGVIVGGDLKYDETSGKPTIDPANYYDRNGYAGTTPEELEQYVLNIYKTLMTRGIKGCYLYFVDKKLESYFRERLNRLNTETV